MLLVSKEALANCVRHSQAHHVTFTVAQDSTGKLVTISIADDGCGFQIEHLPRINGLENMRQRAQKVGADLVIESSPGTGTRVRMVVRP